MSDDAPHFLSSEFKSFAEHYGFTHVTSNANGEAERAVQTAKMILKQDDPCLGLMVYRDTVIVATWCSPVQLMMDRHIRTTLPTLPTAHRPRWPNSDLVPQRDLDTMLSYRRNYDRHHGARPLPPLCQEIQ